MAEVNDASFPNIEQLMLVKEESLKHFTEVKRVLFLNSSGSRLSVESLWFTSCNVPKSCKKNKQTKKSLNNQDSVTMLASCYEVFMLMVSGQSFLSRPHLFSWLCPCNLVVHSDGTFITDVVPLGSIRQEETFLLATLPNTSYSLVFCSDIFFLST